MLSRHQEYHCLSGANKIKGYCAMKLANHSSVCLLVFLQKVTPLENEYFSQRVKMRMENGDI